jgi:NitT/TauT family transport system ATP-binding protein
MTTGTTAAPKTSSGDVLLHVEKIKLRLGDNLILNNLSFEVIDRIREGTCTGQVVGLLGPSGVGKTRLLRLIAGLDQPDAGTIKGHKGAELTSASVGYVFQDYPLLRHRTVESNLTLAGKIGGQDEEAAKRRAKELLGEFKLAERASFYPAQLSGGQRQRVAIAQQLMQPRRLLLMDEPFSGLDPSALDSVMSLVTEVANLDEHNTILVVTHDIRASMIVSDTLHMIGRDKKDDGTVVEGAHVKWSYDMVERGLAYRKHVEMTGEFATLEREIKSRFEEL